MIDQESPEYRLGDWESDGVVQLIEQEQIEKCGPRIPKLKSSFKSMQHLVKEQGTCKQGERSDLTGCVPASGTPGTPSESKPDATSNIPQQDKPAYVNEPIVMDRQAEFEPPKELYDLTRSFIYDMDPDLSKAVKWYTGNGFDNLNTEMRECPPEFECIDGSNRKNLDKIEKALAEAPPLPENTITFRGVSLSDKSTVAMMSAAKECMESGKEFRMPSLTSTSIRPAAAAGFGEGVLFRIAAKRGIYVEPITENKEEFEILQSSKTRYRVVEVKQADYVQPATSYSPEKISKKNTIFLEEITDE